MALSTGVLRRSRTAWHEPPTPPTITGHEQQVWGLRGADDALRGRIDADGDDQYTGPTADRRYDQLTDSSFGVVAHLDVGGGQVRQRMSYDSSAR